MARRPSPRTSSKTKKQAKTFQFIAERLEERQMLLVLHDGDTFTWRGPEGTYNLDTITVSGNPGSTEIEVVFGRYSDEDGSFILGNAPGLLNGAGALQPKQANLPPPPTGNNPNFFTRPAYFNDTIFSIYVAKSDSSSSIGVEEFDATTGAALDYTNSIGVLNFTGTPLATNRGAITAPDGTGTLLMGGRTATLVATTNNTSVPPPIQPNPINQPLVTGTPQPGSFTILPPNYAFTAGISTASGNDFGSFVFGGTVLGTANFGGSLGSFYAGWTLFGSNWGLGAGFSVAGNAQSIVSKGSFGTDDATLDRPALLDAGFDLHVGGRLGQVRTVGESDSDFLGSVAVGGAASVPGTAATVANPVVNETEFRNGDGTLSGLIGQDPSSQNDTFDTPEILPVSAAGTTSVNGSLNILPPTVLDYVDYYGVALMAGQTITVQVVSQGPPVDVGVFDPDGVEVATDYNAVDSTFTFNQPFQYTATKAGLYRFAVGVPTNPTFMNASTGVAGVFPYNLSISNIGNLSFGGVLAARIVRDIGPTGVGFSDSSGDLGAVMAIGGVFESQDNDTFVVSNGNLRAAQGTSLDDGSATLNVRPMVVAIPNGSVGLMSATSGTLSFNTDPLVPLGGSIDILSAATTAYMNIQADGSVGVIRAADMATTVPSFITCNFLNNPNTPATLDLLQVTGDLGTLAAGGPHITMGPRGNVRYMVVGGTVYRDSFFGGGFPEGTQFQLGEATQIIDDSGSVVTLTPNAQVTDPTTGTVTTPAGTLTVTTYGIEGSGGSAIVNVTSTGTVSITTNGDSPGQTAEIGTIDVQGTGTTVIAPPTPPQTVANTGTTGANGGNGVQNGQNNTSSISGGGVAGGTVFPAPGTPGGAPIKTNSAIGGNIKQVPLPAAPVLSTTGSPLDFMASGNARLDVYDITGGNFTSIQNMTGGEIVNIAAASVGKIVSNGTVGIATPSQLGEAVNGPTIFSNTYPFVQQHYGVDVNSAASGVVSIQAAEFGNIIVEGAGSLGIGTISGYDAGPVVSAGEIYSASLTGMSWGGSGAPGYAGLYAADVIGTVSASGDIRGNIVSMAGVLNVIVGNNASLINAQILHSDTYSSASALSPGITETAVASPITNPVHDMVKIAVSGTGGIIGTRIVGEHIGTITSGGFGMFDAQISVAGDGTVDTVAAAGYGLRFGGIIGGALASNIEAIGNGSLVPTSNFSASVRQSETNAMFDPHTGLIFSPLNDIDVSLGATAAVPIVAGTTDTGIIEDETVEVSRNVGLISAYEIRSRDILVGGVPLGLASTFDIANQIGTLQTTGGINGLSLTTGRINLFKTSGDIAGLSATIAGAINQFVFNSSLDSSSVINAIGPNGHIGTLIVKGNLAGSITAQTFITNIQVYGSITGTITAARIGTVHVRGGLAQGGLVVNGPISNLLLDGNGGVAGNTITINGNSNQVRIGRDLAASLMVSGNLNMFLVNGSILTGSNSVITGSIKLLRVLGDLQAGASVMAAAIKRQTLKGQVLGSLIIG